MAPQARSLKTNTGSRYGASKGGSLTFREFAAAEEVYEKPNHRRGHILKEAFIQAAYSNEPGGLHELKLTGTRRILLI